MKLYHLALGLALLSACTKRERAGNEVSLEVTCGYCAVEYTIRGKTRHDTIIGRTANDTVYDLYKSLLLTHSNLHEEESIRVLVCPLSLDTSAISHVRIAFNGEGRYSIYSEPGECMEVRHQ